jgi:hypothetical protein
VSRVRGPAAAVATTIAMVNFLGDAAAELPKCRDAKSRPDFTMPADKLRACYGERPAACFALDVGATGGPRWVAVTAPAKSYREDEETEQIVAGITIGTTAKLCAADGTNCHTFVTPRATVAKWDGPQVYTNPDRSVFAVTIDDDIRLYDPSGSQRVTIKTWSHPGDIAFHVDQVVVSGYRVYVRMRSGNDADVRAFDVRDGSPSTVVGVVDPVDPIDLGGGRLAFTTRRAASLDVYDQFAKRVHTVPLFADARFPATVFTRSGDGKSIVVAQWSEATVAVVDTGTWTAAKIAPPPACP